MVIDNKEGDRDIHCTQEKIIEMPSNGFATDREMTSNSFTTDRALTHYSSSDSDAEKSAGFRASVQIAGGRDLMEQMKCERKRREGNEKEGKFWLKYFEGSEKWSSPKFAIVISHGF